MLKTIIDNKYTFLLLIVITVLGSVYISSFSPTLSGDGKEYVMQTIAFQNHFSFGITVEDIEQAKTEFYNEASELDEEYYINPRNHLHDYKNAKYSNHYGSYSALVFPVKVLVMALGKYPVWAFFVTNYLLYMAAAFVVFFILKVERKKKLLMVMLTVVNPVVFYLGWTHSEVYLYAFVVIGLVFYYNRQYGRAIFFLCVAAMQNLAVIPFAIMVGINLITNKIIEYRNNNRTFNLLAFLKQYTPKILPYGLCYIPGLLPIASTYLKFHKINLVADVRSEHKYLLHKMLDYAFDLNLGILPYEPIILIMFIVMVVYGLKKIPLEASTNLLGVGGMLFVISNHMQINCGMQNIMRYNVWIVPIMIFFVILRWENVFAREKYICHAGFFEIIFTAVIILYVIKGGGAYSCFSFAPWTKAVMNHVPSIYNPTHGIFYSRATGIELYYQHVPVVYKNEKGHIKKILLSKEAEDIFYSNEWILCNHEGKSIDKKSLNTAMIDEDEFKYVNLYQEAYHISTYKLGDDISFFSKDNNSSEYVISGISKPEDWGTWTDSDKAVFAMHVGENLSKMHFYMDVIQTFYRPQHVNVYVNNDMVYSAVIEGNQDIEFDFSSDEDILWFRIETPDAVQPSAVIDSVDRRHLGLGIGTIMVTEK